MITTVPAPTPAATASPFPPTPKASPVPIGGSKAPTGPATPSGRMKIANATSGRISAAYFLTIVGVEGVGKSSLAAAAPAPIFLCSESGTSELDVRRFPEPHSWAEVLEACDEVLAGEHDRKAFVIDTLDWLEPLCWDHVAQKAGKADIEAFGFGKGYIAALDEWRVLHARLEAIRAKGIHVILLAHQQIKPFRNPTGEDYDRFEMKLHAKAGALFREASDACLFAMFETSTMDMGGRTKGVQTGRRLLMTQRQAAYDAKNRFNLPPFLLLEWTALDEAIKASRSLRGDVDALIARLPAEQRPAYVEWLKKPRATHELAALKARAEEVLATAAAPVTATDTNATKKESK